MTQAKLNSELIATEAGDITVFNYDGETREYISASTEYLAVGVGIPAYSCLDAPGTYKAGYAICRSADFNSWEYVPDHRGEIVFSTETGESKEITAPGDYPENTTTNVGQFSQLCQLPEHVIKTAKTSFAVSKIELYPEFLAGHDFIDVPDFLNA